MISIEAEEFTKGIKGENSSVIYSVNNLILKKSWMWQVYKVFKKIAL